MMSKTYRISSVVVLVLALAGVAGAAPAAAADAPARLDAMAFAEMPAPLGIEFPITGSPVALAGDDFVGVSTVGTALGSTTVADATPAAIPLPAGVYVGLVGLASTFAAWRRCKRKRI